MTTSPYQDKELGYDPFSTDATDATTSADRAISQDGFHKLIDAAEELDPLLDLEMKFLLYSAGRLGLRAGEIIHMNKDWVNFDQQWISIPKHEPCTKGKDGGICGYCRQLAEQMAEVNDITEESAKSLYWKAKTTRASRDVPYSFHDDCAETIEQYFERFDVVRCSKSKLSRKFRKASESAGVDPDETTPHALRATAAMYHVESGLDMWGLQSFMGWAYPNTARRYILNNSRRTKKLLEEKHEMTER